MTVAVTNQMQLTARKESQKFLAPKRVTEHHVSDSQWQAKLLDITLTVIGWTSLLLCGSLLGLIVGLYAGWYVGTVYVDEFEPVYFSDYADLAEISRLCALPRLFAQQGRVIGALVGSILTVTASWLFSKRSHNSLRHKKQQSSEYDSEDRKQNCREIDHEYK